MECSQLFRSRKQKFPFCKSVDRGYQRGGIVSLLLIKFQDNLVKVFVELVGMIIDKYGHWNHPRLFQAETRMIDKAHENFGDQRQRALYIGGTRADIKPA
jgi:hypothetical protein